MLSDETRIKVTPFNMLHKTFPRRVLPVPGTPYPFQRFCSKKCQAEFFGKNEKQVCVVCGKEFVGRKNIKHCSPECRLEFCMVNKICPTCGKKFKTTEKNQTYCSYECRPSVPPPAPVTIKTCPVCEEEFETNLPQKIYCSEACRLINQHRADREKALSIKRVCPVCGGEFTARTPSAVLCPPCRKERMVESQLHGGPTREFVKFILILRELDWHTYKWARKIYNKDAPRRKHGQFKFDVYLAETRKKILNINPQFLHNIWGDEDSIDPDLFHMAKNILIKESLTTPLNSTDIN